MDNSDKKFAYELYENKISKLEHSELLDEIKKIFFYLNDAQIKTLLQSHEISVLAEKGIDEEKFNKFIEKINEGEYYIECIEDADSYLDDCRYYDKFKICPLLKDAVEYCFILFKKKDYQKAYDFADKLLSLEVNFKICTEYDDEYYDTNVMKIEDCFLNVGYRVNVEELKYLYLALVFKFDYSYNMYVLAINKLNRYMKDFSKVLTFVENKTDFDNKLKQVLIEDINRHQINDSILSGLLDYINDEEVLKLYAYNYSPISPSIFEKYFLFLKAHNKDTKQVIIDALNLLKCGDVLERFAKLAIELEPTNDEYKFILYKSNSYKLDNFFELYTMEDYKDIPNIVEGNFHKALATFNTNYIKELTLDELLCLMECYLNKFPQQKYDDTTLNNISKWRNNFHFNQEYIDDLYNIAYSKLINKCNEILGKYRDGYYQLAYEVYKLDYLSDFAHHLKYHFMNEYYRYTSFKKELNKIY